MAAGPGTGGSEARTQLQTDTDEKGGPPLSPSALPAFLLPPILAWWQCLVLLRITKAIDRSFYELEATRESRSGRELEREREEAK